MLDKLSLISLAARKESSTDVLSVVLSIKKIQWCYQILIPSCIYQGACKICFLNLPLISITKYKLKIVVCVVINRVRE